MARPSLKAFLLAFLFLLGLVTIASTAPVPLQDSNLKLIRRDEVVLRSLSGSSLLIKRDDSDLYAPTIARRNIFKKIGKAFKKAFHKVKEGFKKVGHAIKNVAKKVGNGIKKVAKKVGHAIKNVAKKVGHGIKTAAKKVGHFIKTTGAKVAKFGLKVLSTAQSIASKVVKFVPGIGSVASKALSAASTATNFVSDKIHANLGKKLEKGMNIMNKIRNPVGGVAGKVLNIL